jgi:hypothetical protein
MNEAAFQRCVKDLAALYGWRYYHTQHALHSPAGWPDVALCRPPRLLLAELKTDDLRRSQPTPEQCDWLEALGSCPGVEVFLWRPADLEQIRLLLA